MSMQIEWETDPHRVETDTHLEAAGHFKLQAEKLTISMADDAGQISWPTQTFSVPRSMRYLQLLVSGRTADATPWRIEMTFERSPTGSMVAIPTSRKESAGFQS